MYMFMYLNVTVIFLLKFLNKTNNFKPNSFPLLIVSFLYTCTGTYICLYFPMLLDRSTQWRLMPRRSLWSSCTSSITWATDMFSALPTVWSPPTGKSKTQHGGCALSKHRQQQSCSPYTAKGSFIHFSPYFLYKIKW